MKIKIDEIKKQIAKTKPYKLYEWIRYTNQLGLTKKNSNPSSNPDKHLFVKMTAETNGIHCFVETGTYLGDMIYANLYNFDKIYSIEIESKLYNRAKKRFKHFKHVRLYCGDSSNILKKLSAKLDQKTLFWLDAHYSGGITSMGRKETPIVEELSCILNKWRKGSVVLIDDARAFGKENEYPTIAKIRNMANDKKTNN